MASSRKSSTEINRPADYNIQPPPYSRSAVTANSSSSWAEANEEDDDDFWQEMEVVRKEDSADGLDEEDQKKYHYVSPKRFTHSDVGNATGVNDDVDYKGQQWRTKNANMSADEMDYTRLRIDEDYDTEEVHLRTKFLFDEDKAMTPLAQMQATKDMLTEAQRIAYVGVCYLSAREMLVGLKRVGRKELQGAIEGLEIWSLKIMGRLYYHMEIAMAEQKMIQILAEHGVTALDLVPPLMTTHTVANPDYDPVEAKRVLEEQEAQEAEFQRTGAQYASVPNDGLDIQGDGSTTPTASTASTAATHLTAQGPSKGHSRTRSRGDVKLQTTVNVLEPSTPIEVPGVSTHLSTTDKDVTLDIRWTILCDLFLILIADSVYDARSRVLLELVASKLGLGWSEVIRFEKRVTEALEIEEGAESLENSDIIESRMKSARRKRYVMLGLATLGGGLMIGLSAGVLAPVIGGAFGATLVSMGAAGAGAALTSTGGMVAITATGALTGSGIAAKGMARRTRYVRTVEILPLHNNRRVNCIITVPGFMNGLNDDVRLPFSVLDPIVGDVYSIRWEPEMMEETGNALKILSTEVLSQVSTTVLQFTVLTGVMTSIAFPLLLTKLGYLIDNPWSNALDRAKAAGHVLADVLIARGLGVRPLTLIGFSLGARMIFYCLQELARKKAYGIVQDVFILGATVTAPIRVWMECRSVVAGRFVNGFARNDWVLGYLFRATTGGINTVAGMRPIENVPGLENVDLTDKIAGHMSYRSYMPLILDQLGFPVSADYFDEPAEMKVDREVVRDEPQEKNKKRISLFGRGTGSTSPRVSRPPGAIQRPSTSISEKDEDEDLPERLSSEKTVVELPSTILSKEEKVQQEELEKIPIHAGFDLKALAAAAALAKAESEELEKQQGQPPMPTTPKTLVTGKPPLLERAESAPPVPSRAVLKTETPSSPSTPTLSYQSFPSRRSESDLQSSIANVDEISSTMNKMTLAQEPDLTTRTPLSSNYPLPPTMPPDAEAEPTLSFGTVDGLVWSPGLTTGSTTSQFSASLSTPFGQSQPYTSTGPIDYGYTGFSNTTSGGYTGFSTSSYGYNSNPFDASSTVSFGGTDGSITLSPSNTEKDGGDKDQWMPKPIGKKSLNSTRSGYNANPWEV
ncbi:hypothetical protein FRC19_011072 [Serendipita sp. 401]|nr:hypothetical protein FRC19_011072 [Serendipita sp. 401]KAG9057681.1 hypothetical protein FS842_004858 [Serendipita sp. 407]